MDLIQRIILRVQWMSREKRRQGKRKHYKQQPESSAVMTQPWHQPAFRRGHHAAFL
jgi:hypothetical protein